LCCEVANSLDLILREQICAKAFQIQPLELRSLNAPVVQIETIDIDVGARCSALPKCFRRRGLCPPETVLTTTLQQFAVGASKGRLLHRGPSVEPGRKLRRPCARRQSQLLHGLGAVAEGLQESLVRLEPFDPPRG
jgi:hypothetical protein